MFYVRYPTCLLCLLIASKVVAADLSVDINDAACDDVTGNPFCSISAALSASVNADVITVNPGTYNENISFSGKFVTLKSAMGPELTEINGNGAKTVVIGPGGHIEGFKITGGVSDFGAGMEVFGAGAVIKANIFDGNVQTAGGYGAGIGGNAASATIDSNIFRFHTCDSQFLSGVVSFVNTSAPLIVNNLFINNSCRGINMTLPTSASPKVYNNTFVGNPTGIYIDRRVMTDSHEYRNNIVYNNVIGIEVNFGTESNNPVFENNLVFGNQTDYSGINDQTGLNGNLSLDPVFADPTNNDYRLLSTSPGIDAGVIQVLPFTDILSNPRVVDGDNNLSTETDIGAYEAQPPIANAGDDLVVSVLSDVSLDASSSSDADGVISSYSWSQTDGIAVNLVNADTQTPVFTAPDEATTLAFELTVTDELGYVTTDKISIQVTDLQRVSNSPGNGGGGAMGVYSMLLLFLLSVARVWRRPLNKLLGRREIKEI